MFKNILLGLGGSVAVGGIGYGVYSSTQSSNGKEENSNEGSETSLAGVTDTGGSEETQSQANPAPAASGQDTENNN